jgi:uncharacterized protein YkwD
MKAVLLRAFLFSSLLASCAFIAGHPAAAGTDDRAGLERQLLSLIDRERADHGLSALKTDTILTDAARGHSEEMEAKNYFNHVSPTRAVRSPMDRYTRAGGRAPSISLAENIYMSSRASASAAHQAFMQSPGHRENILDRSWRKVGVGIRINDRGEIWVTEMFSD